MSDARLDYREQYTEHSQSLCSILFPAILMEVKIPSQIQERDFDVQSAA